MKLIGEIENVSHKGLWILRSEITPQIGSKVYNQQKKIVGRITNVIGPVTRPYLLIKPVSKDSQEQLQLIGMKLYTAIETKIKRRKY